MELFALSLCLLCQRSKHSGKPFLLFRRVVLNSSKMGDDEAKLMAKINAKSDQQFEMRRQVGLSVVSPAASPRLHGLLQQSLNEYQKKSGKNFSLATAQQESAAKKAPEPPKSPHHAPSPAPAASKPVVPRPAGKTLATL
jgi:hypothetical protein